jgi:NAD(P)H-flavin reductase
MPQIFRARVGPVRDLTHDVRELELCLEDPASIRFAAGQFVSFHLDIPGRSHRVARAYSIASSPSRSSTITLLFNLVPGGPGSSFLYGLRPGDAVQFRGPAGTFTLRDAPERDLLLVATGTGIAPLRSMLLARLEQPGEGRILLVWGLRNDRDLYYQDEFCALARQHARFSFVATLSQPSHAWRGASGHVQSVIETRVRSVEGLSAYVCGNSAMIATVAEMLTRKGPCPIHREQYYLDATG